MMITNFLKITWWKNEITVILLKSICNENDINYKIYKRIIIIF